MTKPYWNHPVLKNPVKWLPGRKQHAASLYQKGFYENLTSNPFARQLEETRADGTTVRFPQGNLIKLTVDSIRDTSVECKDSGAEKDSGVDTKSKVNTKDMNRLWIFPIINRAVSQEKFYYNANHILNNRRYLESVVRDAKLSKRFLPRKVQFNSSSDIKRASEFLPHFSEVVKHLYENNIVKLAKGPFTTKGKNGIIIGTQGPLIIFRDNVAVINISKLVENFETILSPQKDSIYIDFEKHPELCELIILLVDYRS
ncbi:hypothetical protein G9P44_000352 [Scheffersomyces stipitis]|nr:hypothetical protein G9P44_000352 [Scheffersomyces stipitis]